MEPIKISIRYANGQVIKGFTQDFFSNKDRFHIRPPDKPSGEAIEVSVKDLKAVFFVRDFIGDAQYQERKKFLEEEKPSGRKVEVTFVDAEVLVGTTLGYEPNRPGFFLFPADSKSNNIRVFVVTSAVKKVRFL